MRRAFPYALFAAVTLAVFWKFLLFGQTLVETSLLESQLGIHQEAGSAWFPREHPKLLVGDNLLLLVDALRRYNEGLKAGEIRLWNPSLCCGLPAYADPMLHPFYPPQLLLHWILPPDPAYELFLLLHLFFSGAAMYWLLREMGRSDLAGTAGGLVWMLLGYNSLWFSTGILAGASVWGPLALLFLLRAFERRDPRQGAIAGIAGGLAILGSHPQHALHLLLFATVWLLVLGWRKSVERSMFARTSALFLLLSLGVGLASVLTRLDTIANGYRNPGVDFEVFYAHPWTLPLHVLDAVAGKASYFENPLMDFEFTVHAGLAAVALAVIGAVRTWRDRRMRFFAVFAVAALAIAFVRPLAEAIRSLPLLGLSPPSRWLFIFGLAASVLAGAGWDALRESPGRIPLLVAAAAGVAGAAVLALFRNASAAESAIGFGLAAGAALLVGRSPRAASALGIVAILFELLPPFLLTNRHVDPAPLRWSPEIVRTAQAREAAPWRGTGALGTPSAEPGSAEPGPLRQDLLSGNNLLPLFGVESIAGFEAIMPESYVKYVLAAGGEVAPGGRATLFLQFRTRLVDAMNLKFAFLPAALPVPPRFKRVDDGPGAVRLYENTGALPRAWLVGRAVPVRTELEALQRISDPDFDPRTSVVLETEAALPSVAHPAMGSVSFDRRSSDRVDLRVATPQAAFLVLADNDYPGWEAELAGTPVPILRANGTFRAVALPAGTYELSFRFRPDSARHGAIGSLAFLLLGLVVVLAPRFRRAA